MKITPKQSLKLYDCLNELLNYHVLETGAITPNDPYNVKASKIMKEIEEANKPLEIKACIVHESASINRSGHSCIEGDIRNNPSICDIRTFVEKK